MKSSQSREVVRAGNKGGNSDFAELKKSRRIKDVTAARSLFSRFVSDNQQRSKVIAQVRNQMEGGRPFDPSELEAQGAAWQTNVNFGDARASRDRTLLPYWKMVNDVPRKIGVTISTANPNAEKWQAAFAENFDKMISEWGSDYFIQFMTFSSNFVNFGPGAVQWIDDRSPRFKAVNVSRMYFPKNTRMSADEWEVIALERDMSASELWRRVSDDDSESLSEKAGWNIKAVKDALVEASKSNNQDDSQDYTRVQDDMVNNDLGASSEYSPISVVWLFIRNFDGKIGCRAFTKNGNVDDFLFSNDNFADDFRHLVGVVWYDTGTDAMVHSIKGFGIKNYHFSVLLNRLKSRLADSMTFSFGLLFQKDSDQTPDEAPPIENYGPLTIFPDGIKQLTIYPQAQQSIGVIQLLANNQQENNSLYREQQRQISETDTATQAKLLAAMQGEMSEASSSMFLSQFGENVFSEMVRRLRIRDSRDRDAIRFQLRLREAGVPDEVIFDYDIVVVAGAHSGMSNPMVRSMKFQQMLALANAPGVNGRWILEQYFTNELGAYGASKALLPEGAQSNPQQRREAIMENTNFGQGVPLPVDQADSHKEHAEEHMKPMGMIAQSFVQTQQIKPEQLMSLVIGLEHTGIHMNFLKADNTQKAAYRQLNQAFQTISSIAQGAMAKMQSDQNAQKQGGGASQPQEQQQQTQQPGLSPFIMAGIAAGQEMQALNNGMRGQDQKMTIAQ